MKLYYLPGACSLASHIALRESGLNFKLEKVLRDTKKTESGIDFLSINPLGYVPALELDNGAVITEGPAILQYIADLQPAMNLLPHDGIERYHAIAWLSFIGTELHKTVSPLFNPAITAEQRAPIVARVSARLDHLDHVLTDNNYLMGTHVSVGDFYLFAVTGWFGRLNLSLNDWPHIARWREAVKSRPAVQAALQAEGLN